MPEDKITLRYLNSISTKYDEQYANWLKKGIVSDKDAFHLTRRLAREEGILVGGSGGAALFAALKIAEEMRKEQTIVTLLPDSGRNYLSKIFSDQWMKEQGFL